MSVPLVTIAVPSYQQGRYLEQALQSLFDQDYPSLEVLVVDGGSTDGSVETIRRYDDRIAWWRSGRDAGQAAALNEAFARARGDFLGWLNADDVLLPGAVAAVVEALCEDPELLLAYGDNELVDEDGRIFEHLAARPWDAAEMLRTCQNHVPQPGSLFTRRAWELAAPLDEDSFYYFDTRFVLELALHGSGRPIDRTLALYRIHAESKTGGHAGRKAADHVRVFGAILDRVDLPAGVRAVAREARARSYLAAAEHAYAALDLAAARRYFARGVRTSPRVVTRRAAALAVRSVLPQGVVAGLRARRAAHGRSAAR